MITKLLTGKTGVSKRKASTILFVISVFALVSSLFVFRIGYSYQNQEVDFVDRIEKASIR